MAEPIPPPPPPAGAAYALMEFANFMKMQTGFAMQTVWHMTFQPLFAWLGDKLNFKIGPVHPLGFLASHLKAEASKLGKSYGDLAVANESAQTLVYSYRARVQKASASESAALAGETWQTQRRLQAVYLPWFVGAKVAPVKNTATTAKTTATHAQAKATTATKAATHAQAIAQTKIDAKTKVKVSTAPTQAHPIPRTQALTIPQAIPQLNGRVGRLEHAARTTSLDLSWLKSRFAALTFAGLVAASLARLGMGWLRCPSLNRIGRKIGCGGFGFLESLLAETFEALVVLDLCKFALATQRLAKIVVPQLGTVLLVQNAVCLGGGATLPSAADKPRVSTRITNPSGLLASEK